jgi:hypothetical protein
VTGSAFLDPVIGLTEDWSKSLISPTLSVSSASMLDQESSEAIRRIFAEKRSVPAPPSLGAAAGALRAAWVNPVEPAPIAVLLDIDVSQVSDVGLLILAAASVVESSRTGSGQADVDDLVAISALGTADWLQIVVNGVKRGAGQYFTADDFLDWIEDDVSTDDLPAIEHGLAWLDSLWRSIGLIDSEDRLTEVGEWVLPRALCHTWGSSFD